MMNQKAHCLNQDREFSSLVDILRLRASASPDKTVYIFLADGEKEEARLTYGELDRQARAVAVELRKELRPGDRALLLYPPGLEFISAFFGCLSAGIIAAPVYPPNPDKLDVGVAALRNIANDCSPKVVLTTKEFMDLAGFIFPDYPDLEKMNWLAGDKIDADLAEEWRKPEIDAGSPAFLQYTSGSTGSPKGVIVSHGNLTSNSEMMRRAWKLDENSVTVCWLPLYHDMGLIGNVTQAVYSDFLIVLMSPASFLEKPVRWLKAISQYKAIDCGAPNFAYDFLAAKVDPAEHPDLDLSGWKLAINAAEAVRSETLKKFSELFAPLGFREETFYPCYGIAEATVFVSGGIKEAPPVVVSVDREALRQNKIVFRVSGEDGSQTLVGCGRTWPDQKIIIVDPETSIRLPDNQIGEIWLSGSNVTKGYWNKPKLTEKIFLARLSDTGEGPFLRTEDLGFMKEGELFVTGRLKDLIIIRGYNYYPHDIERTVERSHPAFRVGCSAAFSIDAENEERLVVVQEVKPEFLKDLKAEELFAAVRKAVSENHGPQVYAATLAKPGSVPKTSSGKIRRRICRINFLTGKLSAAAQWSLEIKGENKARSLSLKTEEGIREWVINTLSEKTRIPSAQISLDQSILECGLDSVAVIETQMEIYDRFNIDFPMESYSKDITVGEFCDKLRELAK